MWPEEGDFPENVHRVVYVIINKRSFESSMCLDLFLNWFELIILLCKANECLLHWGQFNDISEAINDLAAMSVNTLLWLRPSQTPASPTSHVGMS